MKRTMWFSRVDSLRPDHHVDFEMAASMVNFLPLEFFLAFKFKNTVVEM